MEKFCPSCKTNKDIDEFSKSKNRKDGHDWRCKDCVNNYVKQRYENNRSSILARMLEYIHSDKGKNTRSNWEDNNRDKLAANSRKFNQSPKGKIASAENSKKQHVKYPEKRNAQVIVMNAIAAGKLPQINTLTCHRCHANQAEHYHHPDYSKPMEVVPLCRQCHIDIHNQS
jgi:hypothetical protein